MSPSRNLARVTVSLGAALSVLCAPVLAQAQKHKVVVVPFAPLYDAAPRTTGEKIAKTLAEGLSSKSSIELVKLPSEGGGKAAGVTGATPEQIAAVEAAKADLVKGKELLAKRRVKPALDALTRAVKGMESNGPALLEASLLVEARLKQAVAMLLMGREKQALEEAIPAALRLAPGTRLTAGEEYQQVFVDLVEKARVELAKAGEGDLRVDTAPSGARVWVDQREAAHTPVVISGLVPGIHYITIRPAGADPYVQVVEIEKGKMYRISPDEGAAQGGAVSTLVTQLSQNELNADSKAMTQSLAKQAGADYAVIGTAHAQANNLGMTTFVYSAKDDSFFELRTAKFDRDMLFAATEINNVANDLEAKLAAGDNAAVTLPRQIAADAKPGQERINEVDFSGELMAAAGAAGSATPATGPRAPVKKGPRAPVGTKRAPVGGGLAPKAAAPEPVKRPLASEAAPAPAPVETPAADQPLVLDFKEEPKAPEPKQEQPKYTFSGGTSIEDEGAFSRPPAKSSGGLLSKWWFWAGAGAVALGAVGIGVAAAGGDDAAPKGAVRW